jgi:hypothetical protein
VVLPLGKRLPRLGRLTLAAAAMGLFVLLAGPQPSVLGCTCVLIVGSFHGVVSFQLATSRVQLQPGVIRPAGGGWRP